MSNIIDPKQALCLANYKDPKSPTFANLYQSALLAGYPESYARNITSLKPQWVTENITMDVKRIVQAEKNLDKYNDYNKPISKIQTKRDIELGKMQVDVSKFILKTQARAKYSEDKEKQAPNVQINIVNYNSSPQNAPEQPESVPVDVEYTENSTA
jgi:hypothetical protein